MHESIVWPLAFNVIRRRSQNNTFGMVRKRADGTPRPHQGWDFEARLGTPAYSIADGTIEFIRNSGDYGLQLCLSFKLDNETLYAFYAHLQKTVVTEGMAVKRNTIICLTGESGNAAGMPLEDQHLHFEIRTTETPRPGLQDRLSPLHVFQKCPLQTGIAG